MHNLYFPDFEHRLKLSSIEVEYTLHNVYNRLLHVSA